MCCVFIRIVKEMTSANLTKKNSEIWTILHKRRKTILVQLSANILLILFECYESKSYFRQFVPERDFSLYRHVRGADTQEDAYLAKVMYQQTPPEGFYAPRRQSQSKQQKGGTVDVPGY